MSRNLTFGSLIETWHVRPRDKCVDDDGQDYDMSDAFFMIRGMILYEKLEKVEEILDYKGASPRKRKGQIF